MKRYTAVILIPVMVICLFAGCRRKAPETQPTTMPTSAPTTMPTTVPETSAATNATMDPGNGPLDDMTEGLPGGNTGATGNTAPGQGGQGPVTGGVG